MTERTLVLIKPDAVARGLTGAILDRYLRKGLVLDELRLTTATVEQADRHYGDHTAQPWYPPLRAFITSGPLVAAVLSGTSAIEVVRLLNGATNAAKADPGTIRGDWALSTRENLVHGSDSPEAAAREIAIWFS